MKKQVFVMVISIFFTAAVFAGGIKVQSPRGGSSHSPGEKLTVAWKAGGVNGTINILLKKQNSGYKHIIRQNHPAGSSPVSFDIPSNAPLGKYNILFKRKGVIGKSGDFFINRTMASGNTIIPPNQIIQTIDRSQFTLSQKPAIVEFKADNTTIDLGQSLVLTIEVNNLTGAEVLEDKTANKRDLTHAIRNGKLILSTTFKPEKTGILILKATNSRGESRKSFNFHVNRGVFDGQLPLINYFRASKKYIYRGESVLLSYSFANAAEATIIENPGGKEHTLPEGKPGRIIEGTLQVRPQVKSDFSLSCRNRFGSESKLINIWVQEKPNTPTIDHSRYPEILKFSPLKKSIKPGEYTDILYAFSNADEAWLENAATGNQIVRLKIGTLLVNGVTETKGVFSVAPKVTTRYRLKCRNRKGTRSRPTTVEVVGPRYPEIVEFSFQKATVKYSEGAWFTGHIKYAQSGEVINDMTGKVAVKLECRENGTTHHSYFIRYPQTGYYTMKIRNKNGEKKEVRKLNVEGMPLGGYDLNLTKTWDGWVHIKYKFSGMSRVRFFHLDTNSNRYINFKTIEDMKGLSLDDVYKHRPSKGYFPARYRFTFTDLNGMETRIDKKVN